MAEADGQEKSEQATSKKLADSRAEGKVVKSIEVNSFVIFTSGMLLILLTQKMIGSKLSDLAIDIFSNLDKVDLTRQVMDSLLYNGFLFLILLIGPILIGISVFAFIASVAQVGLKFSGKALMPKGNKLNPINGIKNILFSSRSAVESVKAFLKFVVVGLFTYLFLKDFVRDSLGLVNFTITQILGFMLDSAYSLIWKVGLVFALIAGIDFIYQKRKFSKDMMMTKQEVKEEYKQSEGDPQVKGHIRRQQLMMARRRMMQDVPKADVVITNPTHFAIALKYDLGKESAPKVLAKGTDDVAQKIKEIAVASGVPLHEDRPLARALYKACDIGDEIPQALFKAVAQVLAYVYQMKNAKKKSIV
jgi:flagellar biosynthetic protein FlhB